MLPNGATRTLVSPSLDAASESCYFWSPSPPPGRAAWVSSPLPALSPTGKLLAGSELVSLAFVAPRGPCTHPVGALEITR